MNIGEWVTRERRGVPHLVESLVADDVITRCGRRLPNEPTRTGGLLIEAPFGIRKCLVCTSTRELEEPS